MPGPTPINAQALDELIQDGADAGRYQISYSVPETFNAAVGTVALGGQFVGLYGQTLASFVPGLGVSMPSSATIEAGETNRQAAAAAGGRNTATGILIDPITRAANRVANQTSIFTTQGAANLTSAIRPYSVNVPVISRIPLLGSLINGAATTVNTAVRIPLSIGSSLGGSVVDLAGRTVRGTTNLALRVPLVPTVNEALGSIPSATPITALGANYLQQYVGSTATQLLNGPNAVFQLASQQRVLPSTTGFGATNSNLQAFGAVIQSAGAIGTVQGALGPGSFLDPDKVLHTATTAVAAAGARTTLRALNITNPNYLAMANIGIAAGGAAREIRSAVTGVGAAEFPDITANMTGISLGTEVAEGAIQLAGSLFPNSNRRATQERLVAIGSAPGVPFTSSQRALPSVAIPALPVTRTGPSRRAYDPGDHKGAGARALLGR